MCRPHYAAERYATDPEYRQRQLDHTSKSAADPERKERKSEADRQRYAGESEWNREDRLNAHHRRRVRKAGGFVDESLDIFDVFEEENYICQICFEPCDPSLRDRDPMMVTIDHIIPIIEGGSHTRENVQTAHFGCNSLKDNHRDEAGKLTAKRQLRKTVQDAI